MAYIANLQSNGNGIAMGGRFDKGLVLGPKEGFYRQLPESIFSGTRARIAIAYSLSPQESINSINSFSENLNSSFLPDTFFFGFKYPSSSLPGTTLNLIDCFAGVWAPPRFKDGLNNNIFLGYNSSNQYFSNINAAKIVVGTTTYPIEWPGLSAASTPGLIGTGSTFLIPAGGLNQLRFQGIQLTNNNIITTQFNTAFGGIGASSPTLSSLKDFLNINPFISNSLSANNSPWGNATAMFLYNPFNTLVLKVHAMGAAGFID